jgi:hypothetical protein
VPLSHTHTHTHTTSSVKRKLRVTLSDQVDKGPYAGYVSFRPCMPYLIDIPCLVPFALTSAEFGGSLGVPVPRATQCM